MIRKIVDDKTYIGCMVYGKTKIPDLGTGKEVPVPRNQWKVMENHHEPIVSKEVFEKAQSLQIRYTKKSKFDRETTLLGGYVKCGNCRRSLTSSSPIHGHIFEKAQSLQIRYTKKSKFDRETTLLGGYVKCGNCRRSLTSSSPIHGHILYS